MNTIRGDLLRKAAELTEQSRDAVYGDPIINMTCAAELKATYRRFAGIKYSPAHNEAIEDALDKISRIATGAFQLDNYVDSMAYIGIAAECQHTAIFDKQAEEAKQLNRDYNPVKRMEDYQSSCNCPVFNNEIKHKVHLEKCPCRPLAAQPENQENAHGEL